MKIIKYQLATEINHGTPEEPDIETVLSGVTMPYTDANYAIAQAEAYQGQITVEDSRSRNLEPRTLLLICWQTMRNACVCWNSPQPLYDRKGAGP